MEAESGSLPPSLPSAPEQPDWLERVAHWKQRASEFSERTRRVAAAGLVVIVALVFGAAWFTRTREGPPVEALLPQVETSVVDGLELAPTSPTPASIMVVHVAGAVVQPGLVELEPPARVADAVEAAGGPTADGDLNRLNLATLLKDEDRVVVPVIGEEPPALLGSPDSEDATQTGPLDLNTATPAELELLPGIGPATAAAIVAHRAEHGPFSSVTALDEVVGIGPAKLAQLRDLVSVDS